MRKIRARSLDLFVAEPFRFFFLFGVIAGLIGVMQWPYMFWAESASYPGQNHAFLMVEGFFAAFIFGFALTALPRMMDSKWRSASGLCVTDTCDTLRYCRWCPLHDGLGGGTLFICTPVAHSFAVSSVAVVAFSRGMPVFSSKVRAISKQA